MFEKRFSVEDKMFKCEEEVMIKMDDEEKQIDGELAMGC
jgi:hypothetical protein